MDRTARWRNPVPGLARGGVPVAAEAATALRLPWDVLPVCKLGVPGRGETAFGALAPANGAVVRVLNRDLVDRLLAVGVSRSALEEVESTERAELLRRAGAYPGPRLPLGGRTVTAPSVRCGTTTSSGCWMPGPPEHQRGVTPRPS